MQSKQARKIGRVIPFERDVEFFLRRGSQRLEKNDLIEAINNYYIAQARDPENVEIQLAIAEVLTEMHRYEESNRLLFPLLSTDESPPECFFGIACNFLGMQEFNHAQDSLESYLSLEPDGDFVPDALDMLDVIEDDTALYTMPGVFSKEEHDAYSACAHSRQLLENGRIEEAVSMLEKLAEENPSVHFVHNNLALAYFCEKNFARAMEVVREVLAEDPDNVQAHCNLLLFLHAARDVEGVARALGFLRKVDTQDPHDWNRMAVVFMETDNIEEALQILKKLQTVFPYDESMLHRLGVCYYKLGRYREATKCYDKLSKLNPSDTVAAYYRKVCHNAAEGEREKIDWLYNYQVPYAELLRRIRALNEIAEKSKEELLPRWRSDKDFRALMLWGFSLPDEGTKRTLLNMIAGFEDYYAETALRSFLLDKMQPDEVKQDVFAMLKYMGAREPYIAYLGGNLVQSKVRLQRAKKTGLRLPVAYQRMLELCVQRLQETRNNDATLKAIEIFQTYADSRDPLPKLRRQQIFAYAAALEYLACKQSNLHITKAQVADSYGVSTVRLTNAINKFKQALEESKE